MAKDFVGNHIRAHLVFYLFITFLFFAALVFGAIGNGSYLPEEIFSDLETSVDRLMNGLSTMELDRQVETVQAFSSNLRLLLLLFLCGITILGFPGALFLAAYRGYLLGATMAMMIAKYGWSGFAWFFGAIFPQNILLVPMVILASAWSADFSLSVLLGRWEGPLIVRKVLRLMVGYSGLLLMALGAAMLQGFAVPYLITLFADI